MIQRPGISRAKLVITEYGPPLAIGLAIIGALALGGAGWIYTHPPTTTVTDQTDKQTVQSALQTSAVVTGESALYREGDRIENQPVYFTSATPNLTLSVQTTVPDEQSVHVVQSIELVTVATYDGTAFWQNTRTLEREEMTTSNGTATTSTALDVRQLEEEIAPVRNEVGSAGSLAVFIRVTTAYETGQYSGTLRDRTRLQLSERTYTIAPVTLETTETTPKTREIVLPTRDASAYTIPAGIGVSALLGAVIVVGLYRRRDRWETVEDQLHHGRYAEWISAGTLAVDIGEQYVPMETLEDLVDIGIDMNKRVIYDSGRGVYAVIDGEMVYYYGEESTWRRSAGNPTNSDGSQERR